MNNLKKVGLAVLLSSSLGLGLITGCSNEKVTVKETVVEQAVKPSIEDLWSRLSEYRKKPYSELPLNVGALYATEKIVPAEGSVTIETEYSEKLKGFLEHRKVIHGFTPAKSTIVNFHEVFQGNGLDSVIYSEGNWDNYIREIYVQPSIIDDLVSNKTEKIVLPSVRWGIKGIAFFDSFTKAKVTELFKLNNSHLFDDYDVDLYNLRKPDSHFGYFLPNSNYYTVKKMPELDLRLVEVDKEYVVIGIHSK